MKSKLENMMLALKLIAWAWLLAGLCFFGYLQYQAYMGVNLFQ